MDMAAPDDWLKRSFIERSAAQQDEPVITADFAEDDWLLEAEVELLDRFVGALIADLFDGSIR